MKNILLIGLGRFGRHLAMELNRLGHQIMAVDRDEERVNECMPFVTNAQIGDSTRLEFLRSLGIGNYDICYVTICGSFQDSLETVSLLKELGAKTVVARADRDVQEKFLLRNGADHLFDYIELDDRHAIVEVAVPERWVGQTVGELNIRRKYGINLLGLKKDGKTDVSVTPDTHLTKDVTILALGEYQTLKKCFAL